MAIHCFEHFYLWEAEAVIAEWRRLLKPGGELVMELPNLIKCCRNAIDPVIQNGKHPDRMSMWGIYGDPSERDPYMGHHWGWSPESITKFLSEHGFGKIREEKTKWHSIGREHRDMRILAVKV
jgi:SAM-dependent methyltransferase